MSTPTNKRTKVTPSYGVGHGVKPHVASPAPLNEFLEAYGISRNRYEKVVQQYIGNKPSLVRHKG
jgi:hypothetical protein